MNPQDKVLTIAAEYAGNRLDQFLCKIYPEFTRSYFNRLIKSGYILVEKNTVKSGYIVKQGDQLEISFIDGKPDLSPKNIPLDIIYEDADVLVINKQAGLIVHPGKGSGSDTLVNALIYHQKELSSVSNDYRPGIVHRLDKNTSGLLLVAKNDKAHQKLQQQFLERSITRKYYALLWGSFKEEEGFVDAAIGRSRRDPTKMTVNSRGKSAKTYFKVLKNYVYMSLVAAKLETGRTHQIRVHMNHIHHPVVGDADYNGRESKLNTLPANIKKRGIHLLNMLPHQFLHAKIIEFVHPVSEKEISIETDLPENLQTILDKLPKWFMLP